MYSFPILRSVGSFLYPNKRTFKWVALLVLSSYTIYKVHNMYSEYRKTRKKLRIFLEDTTRLNRILLRSRKECTPSILNFLKILNKRVVESIDVVNAVKR